MPDVRRTVKQNMEWMDLQKYVLGEYKEQLSKEFLQRIDGDFFILSMEDFEKYPFLNNKFNRIRLDEEGDPIWWWTASPRVGYGNNVRNVHADGYIDGSYAGNSTGVAPACRIHLESIESAPAGAADDVLTEIRDLLTQIAKAVS